MATPLNGQSILNKFHLYVGDQSELSTTDELDLLNKIYADILQDRNWEFLKKTATGNISTVGGIAVISLPSDFRYFAENNEKTDNSQTIYNNASPKVVFIGPNYTPYQIVNWSDRRQFRNTSQFCYLDLANNQIVFTTVPPDTSYEFDYISNWDDITLTTYPLFPADFHDMIYQGMAVDSTIINLFDRAHSYAKENQNGYDEALKKLRLWNSQFTLN